MGLGEQSAEDQPEADHDMRQPGVNALVGESEQEGGRGKDDATHDIGREVHDERQQVDEAALVVGDEALQQDHGSEHHRNGDRRRPGVGEAEEDRSRNQQQSGRIVEHPVQSAGDRSGHAS
jgi:hypothetical protein